jgi:tRNA(adenine34) deaminase
MIDFNETVTQIDRAHIERAIELALAAESKGNMPIGSVIAIDEHVIAEGQNQLLTPEYNPGGHAEIEAIRNVEAADWRRAAKMTCYSTLEPCIMCTGTILLHGMRRVVFGAYDSDGGGRHILKHLPPYYSDSYVQWLGPVDTLRCRPLYERALDRFQDLPCGQP